MENFAFATVGVEPNDLTSLKSMLNLVAGSAVGWSQVEEPEQAHVTFVCGLAPAQLVPMMEKVGALTVLVYCCGRGETPPEGVFTLRRPLQSSVMKQILDEVKTRLASGKL